MNKIISKAKIVLASLAVVGGLLGTMVAANSVVPVGEASALKCADGKTTVDKISDCPEYAGADNKAYDINTLMSVGVNVFLGIVGFIAVIVIIFGGFSYTTSAGDAAKVKKAKDTIMYGIIGLVIAILAFAIVNFVLNILKQGTA